MPDGHFSSTAFSPVIVAPTYNNSATLGGILKHLSRLDLPIIVVNDGSTDTTETLLKSFPSVHVQNVPTNCGKAAALRLGFARAAELAFTHVLTIDTDGQHDPDEIPKLLEQARQSPQSLILGTRQRRITGYPIMNRVGRWASNTLVWIECGQTLDDTQCGMRVYPLQVVQSLPCTASRYGFETEVLTRAAWSGFSIAQVPVACRYDLDEGRISHFRPWIDSFRAVGMHTQLMAAAVPRWPLRLARTLHPVSIWRDLRSAPAHRNAFAGGLAVGVFCACLPLYGIQGLLSLIGAKLLRFNPLSALAGSQLSSPPVSAVLIAVSMALGHLLLNGHWPSSLQWEMKPLEMMKVFALDWAIGSVVLGAALSLATYVLVRALLGGRLGVSGMRKQLIQPDGGEAAILQTPEQLVQSGDRD